MEDFFKLRLMSKSTFNKKKKKPCTVEVWCWIFSSRVGPEETTDLTPVTSSFYCVSCFTKGEHKSF